MMSESGITPIIEWVLYNQGAFTTICLGSVLILGFALSVRERNRQVSLRDLDKRIAKLEKAVDILVQLNKRDRSQP